MGERPAMPSGFEHLTEWRFYTRCRCGEHLVYPPSSLAKFMSPRPWRRLRPLYGEVTAAGCHGLVFDAEEAEEFFFGDADLDDPEDW